MVSFLAVVSLVLLATTVCAVGFTGDLAEVQTVRVEGVYVGQTILTPNPTSIAVVAGDTLSVQIVFEALNDDSDVTVEVELEGDKDDTRAITEYFDVEQGMRYTRTLNVEIPFELEDDVSDDLTLHIEVDGKEYNTQVNDIALRVQRPSYDGEIKSVTFDQSVSAGETFPVDVVVENMGYNDLDDIYLTVSIPELGLTKSAYFGDLAPLESCGYYDEDENYHDCDKEDTLSGRLYLSVPYEAKAGSYTVKVDVSTEDMDATVSKQIVITNSFAENVIVASTSKVVGVGEDAVYSILLINPTDELKVYTIVADGSGLSLGASDTVVAVPAGSSKTVTIAASADEAGQYTFTVNVLEGSKLAKAVTFSLEAEKEDLTMDPIVILTIVLAIVFVVLLVVLIVLIAKKPAKSEEFGESYY